VAARLRTRREGRLPPATFRPAHALAIRSLPRKKQCQKCLWNRHNVPLSWSSCVHGGHRRYPGL